ncbi:hypothetical protein QRC94_004456 [Vibrio vulnificus]|nr:hypothetical protein [Vibrio vulnificus]EJC6955680.1 hypothetical protein [Vibrio vulnificus]EKQ3696694.1 hypothetical protein [Vibrio vulnificus]ELR8548522.1 hypothetical protein [Vibrio vulnificus]ELR8553371.1 hypothetical protein [Vibrio vulnificus]
MGLVIKSLCGSFCIACLHPLTQRYNFWRVWWLKLDKKNRILKNGLTQWLKMV